MKQLLQGVRDGELRIVDGPDPVVGHTEVLVETSFSVVSPGTERAIRSLAQASLLSKARARPDLVRQVVNKAKAEGLRSTFEAVRSRLEDDMPLGYSAAGTVVAVGEAVEGLRPGMRVATGGAGHGDLQVVSSRLAVPLTDSVGDDAGAFSTIGSIALHGIRLADLGPGSTVGVIGLGLLGQLATRIATAIGIEVVGIDLREWTLEWAARSGARTFLERGTETTAAILDITRGVGLDAVVVMAATPSSEPMRRAADLLRDRGTIVLVGDAGLELDRRPLYEKELTVKVARSYGPGRYDRSYEEWGVDYPIGHVRWTEQRNMETIVKLLASGALSTVDLITHRFPFEEAPRAYRLIENKQAELLGVQLTYSPERVGPERTPIGSRPRARSDEPRIGLVGAGSFARGVLLPSMRRAGLPPIVAVASATGSSAASLASKIEGCAATSIETLLDSEDLDLVVIATPHENHAELVIAALESGKHVFCEKPLALDQESLENVERVWRKGDRHLSVGFNRRHSPSVRHVTHLLGSRTGPISIGYRVAAGRVPEGHWYNDRKQGGRLLGEACHFVDTCNAVVGSPLAHVMTYGSGRGEALLEQDFLIALGYEDGSSASISYVTEAHPATPKERVEVLGRGHTFEIDDYSVLSVDGRAQKGFSGKGHVDEFTYLRAVLRGEARPLTADALYTTAATLAAARSLMLGTPVSPMDS